MKKFIITEEQINLVLQALAEMKAKESFAAIFTLKWQLTSYPADEKSDVSKPSYPREQGDADGAV